MDYLALDDRVTKLFGSRDFVEAERELLTAKRQAAAEGDHFALEQILSSLGHMYCLMEPQDIQKAEACLTELEQVSGKAHAKAQTAMMLYWSMHDPTKTLAKAQEAIAAASNEDDQMTLYQTLGLSGLALLDLGRLREATGTIERIGRLVDCRSRIVVGDETLFFERLYAATPEEHTRSTIQRLANTLWPVCREAAFAERLKRLAGS